MLKPCIYIYIYTHIFAYAIYSWHIEALVSLKHFADNIYNQISCWAESAELSKKIKNKTVLNEYRYQHMKCYPGVRMMSVTVSTTHISLNIGNCLPF